MGDFDEFDTPLDEVLRMLDAGDPVTFGAPGRVLVLACPRWLAAQAATNR